MCQGFPIDGGLSYNSAGGGTSGSDSALGQVTGDVYDGEWRAGARHGYASSPSNVGLTELKVKSSGTSSITGGYHTRPDYLPHTLNPQHYLKPAALNSKPAALNIKQL